MKKRLLCSLITLMACQSPKKEEQAPTTISSASSEQATTKQNSDNFENTTPTPTARPDFPIGSVVYVLSKAEELAAAPAENQSQATEAFALGSKLVILGEEGLYYKVKKGSHEGYILKSEVGYQYEAFTHKELEQVSSLIEYKGTTHTPKDLDNLSEFFSISLISEADYQQALQHSPKPFDKGEEIEKKGKILSLPCQKKAAKYEDNSLEGFEAIYTYVGEHEAIGQYIVQVTGSQVVPYILTDKITGNELYMDGFPLLSADKKHIITLHTDPIHGVSDIALYHIEGTTPLRLKALVKASFAWWKCAMSPQTPIFLGEDNALYAAIYPLGLPEEHPAKLLYIRLVIKD